MPSPSKPAIADVDETIEGELSHPSLVLILELDDGFIRVIVPEDVLGGRRDLLAVGETVKVSGEVQEGPYGSVHVARQVSVKRELH